MEAFQGTNGAWVLLVDINGEEKEWPFSFASENQAMLFAAMNESMIRSKLSK